MSREALAVIKVDENGHELVCMRPGTYEEWRADDKAKTLALRNVLMLARREKRRPGSTPDAMDHMIRFCREAGVVPTVLREAGQISEGVGDGRN